MRLTHKLLMTCAPALCLAGNAVQAQDTYPARPIRFIVPFAPGGITGLIARTFAKYMGDALHRPPVTGNKPVGGAAIGHSSTRKQKKRARPVSALASNVAGRLS